MSERLTSDPREMFRHLPFPDGRFPPQLGALVQTTVADGVEPAREVVHTDDNSWMIGDGVNDPNLPGAAIVLHLHHVLRADPLLEGLASLPDRSHRHPRRAWTTLDDRAAQMAGRTLS